MPIALTVGRARRGRGGTIAMELLFNLPIWMIVLAGVVEFGEGLSCAQHVALASRIGALEAARTPSLCSAHEVPEEIRDAIVRSLAVAGMSQSKILLEHNVGSKHTTLVCGDGPGDPPRACLPRAGESVRVTVFARMNGAVPRLLRCLGLDVGSRLLTQSVTFRYRTELEEGE